MINSLKIIVSIFFILLATTNTFSQTASKEVSITASGSGKTQDDAKQAAEFQLSVIKYTFNTTLLIL
jgi:hypothetical protein